MFFIARFIIVWAIWLIFADKKRWREIFPVSIFAALLGSTTDTITSHYKLWRYHGDGVDLWLLKTMDDLGIYIVVAYLFIQWLPTKRTFLRMAGYWFVWTGLAISIEWLHIVTGHMEHYLWWGYICSYAADWFLFWLFYQYHKLFRLERLN
jgi:hypothetical protein